MRVYNLNIRMRDFSRYGFGLALLLSLAGCVGVAQQVPPYRVGDLQPGDEAAVTAAAVTTAGGAVVIDIRSETGIGSAAVEQILDAKPTSLTLRFHLKGLEELRFTYAGAQVALHVSSLGENGVSQEVTLPGGEAQSIGPDSPYWMAVRLPAGQTIPLTGGAIEVTAPRAFLKSDAHSFSLRWIDFYR